MIFHRRFSKAYKVSQFEKVKVYNGIHISRKGSIFIHFLRNAAFYNSSQNAQHKKSTPATRRC